MNIPPYGDQYKKINAHFMSLKVSAQTIPSMSVKVSGGGFWFDRTAYVNFPGGSTPELTKPLSQAKFVIIGLTKAGVIKLIDGQAKANPELPSIEPGFVPLAAVLVKSSTEMITEENIFDIRPIIQSPNFITSHNQIGDRDLADAHPIESITGLQDVLDEKLDTELLYNHLANKADVDGTPSPIFMLNNDTTEIPVEEVSIVVDRGTEDNVKLSWNEHKDRWIFEEDVEVKGFNKGVVISDLELTEDDQVTQKAFRIIARNGSLGLQDPENLSVSFAQDQFVKASETDVPGFLIDKVDLTTLDVVDNKLTLADDVLTKINEGVTQVELSQKVDSAEYTQDMANKVSLTDYNATINSLNNQLASKIDGTTLDTRLSTQTANVNIALQNKVELFDFENAITRIDEALDNRVDLNTYLDDMTNFNNDLQNKVNFSQYNNRMNEISDVLATKVSSLTYTTKMAEIGGKITSAETKAGEVETKVQVVEGKVDTIETDMITLQDEVNTKISKNPTEDITFADVSTGVVLTSPNGTQFRLTVADDGALTATQI